MKCQTCKELIHYKNRSSRLEKDREELSITRKICYEKQKTINEMMRIKIIDENTNI